LQVALVEKSSPRQQQKEDTTATTPLAHHHHHHPITPLAEVLVPGDLASLVEGYTPLCPTIVAARIKKSVKLKKGLDFLR